MGLSAEAARNSAPKLAKAVSLMLVSLLSHPNGACVLRTLFILPDVCAAVERSEILPLSSPSVSTPVWLQTSRLACLTAYLQINCDYHCERAVAIVGNRSVGMSGRP